MRWGFLVVTTAVVMTAAPATATGQAHSVWVWSGPASLDIDAIAVEGFNQIYLWAPPGFSADPDYAAVIDQAHAAGLEILAVGGDPSWATDPGEWRSWAREVESAEWDGAVVNVEPYLHPDWDSRRAGVISEYLRGIRSANRVLTTPLFPTVPFWFDSVAHRKASLLDEVAKQSDGIVVLAYRDRAEGADGILDLVVEELGVGEARNISVIIAVETAPVAPEKITFFEEGRNALDGALDVVRASLSESTAFAGTSVHHWETFQALAP